MNRSQAVSRQVLAAASWVILIMVAVGFITLLPAVASYFSAALPGSFPDIVSKLGGALTGLALLSACIAGIWHAGHNTGFRSNGLKVVVLMCLVVANALAALVYYFAYVRWQPEPSVYKVAA